MKPKIGQIWKIIDKGKDNERFIFITKLRDPIRAVHYYHIGNPNRESWDYEQQFIVGHYYEFVSG